MKIYHYDHCPYCVKARSIFGLKNLEVEEIILANDDEKTPTDLVGKKMVPILIKEDGTAMGESLDIIKYIDSNYGSPIVDESESYFDVSEWLSESRDYLYYLAMPRFVQMPLKEFESESARNYFQEKKERLNIGPFKDALDKSETYIDQAQKALIKLSEQLGDKKTLSQKGDVHIDDIHLFATLRSLSTVKDIQWPENVLAYLNHWAQKTKVNLYFDIAI